MQTYYMTPWTFLQMSDGRRVLQARIVHTATKFTIDYALRVDGQSIVTTKTGRPLSDYGL
jgi:hypothetical protein